MQPEPGDGCLEYGERIMGRRTISRGTRCGPWVTLMTDFGGADAYVGAMKGVLASLAPSARVMDTAHEIRRGDIAAGAWVLSQYWRWWPCGTIHVAVVDPGVGTSRAPLLARADRHWFIAPDNGLLSGVALTAQTFQSWRLSSTAGARTLSATFHGRDLFAVVAARLASGEPWRNMVVGPIEILRLPEWRTPERISSNSKVRGLILHIDRFGNAITNLRLADLPPIPWRLHAGSFRASQLHQTYADVAPGQSLAYIGSAGYVELAVRDGSAALRYRLRRGMFVHVVCRQTGQDSNS